MKTRAGTLTALTGLVALLGTAAASPPPEGGRGAGAAPAVAPAPRAGEDRPPLVDAPLAAHRIALIELALDAAGAIPRDPHVKDRARAMAAVAGACLRLEQPRRALACVERIDNWRRGAGYADVAFHGAQRGYADEVREWLERAEAVADAEEDWRRDHVRVKIARVHAWLGEESEAAELEAGVEEAEAGKVDGVRALRAGDEDLEARIASLETAIGSESFDLTRNAMTGLAELYDRCYADEKTSGRLEETIRTAAPRLPALVRVELLMTLVEAALRHEDRPKALEIVDFAQGLVTDGNWTAEYHVPTIARLAALRHRAGDHARAQADLAAMTARFDRDRHQIGRVFRAEALRPVAEAHAAMGDAGAALAVFKRVVEIGADNPNARSRALDLSATCLSLAESGVEPDEELWGRLRGIRAGLGDPW